MMSEPLSLENVLYRQRLLSCSGLYTRRLDGVWGRHTDDADAAFDRECDAIAAAVQRFDPRSERNIRTLRLDAQRVCRESLYAILELGMDARVISGTRTYAEQASLYRKGRFGNNDRRVTNAKAGQSWHNFGLAWDIGIFRDRDYLTEGPEYAQAAAVGKIAGVEWGGDWQSFQDRPHYQTPFGAQTISEARASFEAGGRTA